MSNSNRGRAVGLAVGCLLLMHGALARAQSPVVVVNHDDGGSSAGVIVSSAVTFGLAYGASVFVAANSTHPGDNRLYVPVLGPWLDIADRGKCGSIAASSCDRETTNKILLVGDGIIQGASAIGFIAGLLTPSHTAVVATKDATVHLTPVSLAGHSPGLGAYGSF
jgi:hypothetical protein